MSDLRNKLMAVLACAMLAVTMLCACQIAEPTKEPTQTVSDAVIGQYLADDELIRAGLVDSVVDGGDWPDKIEANKKYLDVLSAEKLLYYYYIHAGIEVPSNLRPYTGCEGGDGDAEHGGMFLGHYLSACSMLYANTKEQRWLDKVNFTVGELAKCQKDNGFLFAKDESVMNKLKLGTAQGVYFYYMHKTLAGLIDAYNCCQNAQALAVAEKLSGWVHDFMSPLTAAGVAQVLQVEYGGMNEAMYNLYAITGNQRELDNANYFKESQYYTSWLNNVDNLYMKHGNTTVPKAVGYVRGYMVTGDEDLLTAAKNFFAMMVTEGNRIFATGGFSEREMIGKANETSEMIYDCPSETCKSYNMMKLAMYLYECTGEAQYIEYAERVLFNSIMGSTDEDGCKTYYQWLCTDQLKVYHTLTTSFWCCTGTGVESFAKVAEAAWFRHGDNAIRTCLFITSSYDDGTIGVKLVNDSEKNDITITRAFEGYLELRVPAWAKSVKLSINGTAVENPASKDGIISVYKNWAVGDKVEYITEYQLIEEPTPDDPDLFAFRYGPYVLAAVGERYEVANYISTVTGIREGEAHGDYIITTPEFEIPMRRYCLIIDELYTVYFRRNAEVGSIKKSIAMRAEMTSSGDMPYLPTDTEKFEGMYSDQRVTGIARYLFPIHDGNVPLNSAGIMSLDKTIFPSTYTYEALTFFNGSKKSQWVGYTFDQKYTITGVRIYWAQSTKNGIALPDSWHIEYYDGMNWATVAGTCGIKAESSKWNEVIFDTPVTTRKLRLVVDSATNFGIYEWDVLYE